jgi:hypothetical protein
MLELDSHSLIHVAQTSLRVVKQPVKHYIFSAKCKAQRARRKGQSVALLFALLLFALSTLRKRVSAISVRWTYW